MAVLSPHRKLIAVGWQIFGIFLWDVMRLMLIKFLYVLQLVSVWSQTGPLARKFFLGWWEGPLVSEACAEGWVRMKRRKLLLRVLCRRSHLIDIPGCKLA